MVATLSAVSQAAVVSRAAVPPEIEIDHRGAVPCPEVAENLGACGIVVLRGLVAGAALAALREDTVAMAHSDRNPRHIRGEAIVATYSWSQIAQPRGADPVFPAVRDFLHQPWVRRVAEDFYDPFESRCECVRSLHYRNKEIGNEHWHIDPTTCLKVFVYLTDTTRENGCFEYAVGSHKDGFLRRLYHHAACGLVDDPNRPGLRVAEADVRGGVPIEAEAGSVLLFNPNGYHRAGLIRPGCERIVLAAYFGSAGRLRHPDQPLPALVDGSVPAIRHDALLGFPRGTVDAMTNPRNLPATYIYRQE